MPSLLPRLPAVSKADCYVRLWLPTASVSPSQTRTVVNSSDPEWNETFHYQIHGAVKVWASKGLGMAANDVLHNADPSVLSPERPGACPL